MSPAPDSKLRSKEEVKTILKNYLQAAGVDIDREFDQEGAWGFWVKFGEFPVLIENPDNAQFLVVAFQITFSDPASIKTLNDRYDEEDNKFILELTRTLTSSLTGFTRVMDRGQIIGFTVMKNIYPFHTGFIIKDLDEALQAVVNAGTTGVAYFKVIIGRTAAFDHTPPRPPGEPGPTFE
jgi:hypothetical protein